MQRRPRPPRRLLHVLVALPALAFLTAQLVLAAPPTPSFTISDATPFRGETVEFGATATDEDGHTISSYEWDFGDGTTASGPDVSHAYEGLGAKTVSLKVTDSANETRVVTDQVTVENRLPTASFSVSDTTPARGQLIGFDATASDPDGDTLSYEWDFGDGATATGANVTRAYPASTSLGAKTVTLTVTDSAGGTTSVNEQVTVQNAPPTASFSVSDTTPVRGQAVNFNATGTDFEDEALTYAWNFGDGTTATGQNVAHTYSALGARTVTLTVTDSANETTVVTDQVTVENRLPTASFTVSDTTPARGQPIDFAATASDPDGDTLSYEWDFGDGFTASGQNVTHAYPAGTSLGAKTVTLTVTDSASGTTTVSRQVTVQNVPPTASFTVSDDTPARGQVIAFNATGTDPDGDTLSYAWNFGDGITASGQNVTHAYPPARASAPRR